MTWPTTSRPTTRVPAWCWPEPAVWTTTPSASSPTSTLPRSAPTMKTKSPLIRTAGSIFVYSIIYIYIKKVVRLVGWPKNVHIHLIFKHLSYIYECKLPVIWDCDIFIRRLGQLIFFYFYCYANTLKDITSGEGRKFFSTLIRLSWEKKRLRIRP